MTSFCYCSLCVISVHVHDSDWGVKVTRYLTSGSNRKLSTMKMPKISLMQNHRDLCVCVCLEGENIMFL